jgi:hypothetical protein
MFDEIQRLRETPELFQLLSSYASAGVADPEAWQDRIIVLDGADPKSLTKLHGELIAFGWIDQNTGNYSIGEVGAVRNCYRVTAAGKRALKLAAMSRDRENAEMEAA